MKISIAMATYNGADYLQEQLDSFTAQTIQPDELVISDDGSTDETVNIIRAYSESCPFKVVWRQNERNLGYARNFNVALEETTGDLVFLSDQDDVWFPNKIEEMVAQSELHRDAIVLMNDAELTNSALEPSNLTKQGQIRSSGLNHDAFMMGCCAVIRREYLKWCLPLPEGFIAHDNALVGIADSLGKRKVIPLVLQYYRRHESNTSQYFVNNTVRITAWGRNRRRFSDFLSKFKEPDQLGIEQSNALHLQAMAELISERVPAEDRLVLEKVIAELKQQHALQHERFEVRKRKFFLRFLGIIELWHQWHNKGIYSLKRAMRDIAG